MNITFKFIQTIFSIVQEVVTIVEQMCSLGIFIDIVIFHVTQRLWLAGNTVPVNGWLNIV